MKGGLPIWVALLVAAGCGGGGVEGLSPVVSPSYEKSLPNGHPLAIETEDPETRLAEDELTRLTNDYLISTGLDSLIDSPEMRKVARAHCKHMIDHAFVSHQNPEGQWPWDRAEAVGILFSGYGENIAVGQHSALEAFQDFLASPDHKRVIEDSAWTHIGCGYWQSPGGMVRYWTQNFKREDSIQNR